MTSALHASGPDAGGPALPADWRRAIDATTGRDYYYHRVSRETTWVLPQQPSSAASSSPSRSIPLSPSSSSAALSSAPQGKLHPPTRTPPVLPGDENAREPHDAVTGLRPHPASRKPSPGSLSRPVNPEQVKHDLTLLKRRMSNLQLSGAATSKPLTPAPGEPLSRGARTVSTPREEDGGAAADDNHAEAQPRSASQQHNGRMDDAAKPVAARKPAARGPTTSSAPLQCTRRSGCTCDACATGGQASDATAEEVRAPCSQCGRMFNEMSLVVHARVCKKVFSARKPAPDSPAKSVLAPSPGSAAGGAASSNNVSKWRRQSAELRNALSRVQPTTPATPATDDGDDGMVQCPHCERRFSEKAAERHVPRCTSIRSKPKTLLRGEGRAAHSPASPSPAAKQRPMPPNSAPQPRRKSVMVTAVRRGTNLKPLASAQVSTARGARAPSLESSSSSWDGKREEEW
jgi:hypothetical protein